MHKLITKLAMCLAMLGTLAMADIHFGDMGVKDSVGYCEKAVVKYCERVTCRQFCEGRKSCMKACKESKRCKIIPLGGTMDEQGSKRQLMQDEMIDGNDALYETTRKQVFACIAQARGNPAAPRTHWKTMVTREYKSAVPNWQPKLARGEKQMIEPGTKDMGKTIEDRMAARRKARMSDKSSSNRGGGKGSMKDRIKAWGG